jgi:hypothetical protein
LRRVMREHSPLDDRLQPRAKTAGPRATRSARGNRRQRRRSNAPYRLRALNSSEIRSNEVPVSSAAWVAQ